MGAEQQEIINEEEKAIDSFAGCGNGRAAYGVR